MTLRRFLIGLGIALLAQSSVFAWQYRDLLYLRQPVEAIERGGPDKFATFATSALTRQKLTRHHLDTIAEAARKFGRSDIEIKALIKRFELDFDEPQVRVRLADALRRGGFFSQAELVLNGIQTLPRQ
jgi:hypothetical protein